MNIRSFAVLAMGACLLLPATVGAATKAEEQAEIRKLEQETLET